MGARPARYDDADVTERSRMLHDGWLTTLPVPVVQLDGDRPVSAQLTALEAVTAAARLRATRPPPRSR